MQHYIFSNETECKDVFSLFCSCFLIIALNRKAFPVVISSRINIDSCGKTDRIGYLIYCIETDKKHSSRVASAGNQEKGMHGKTGLEK